MKYNSKQSHRNLMKIDGNKISFCNKDGIVGPNKKMKCCFGPYFEGKTDLYDYVYNDYVSLYLISKFDKALPKNEILRKSNTINLEIDNFGRLEVQLRCSKITELKSENPYFVYYFDIYYWLMYENLKVDGAALCLRFNR